MGLKIYAISDLHLSFQVDKPMDLFGGHWTGYEQKVLEDWNAKVGADDIGIIAGDISWAMKSAETEQDFEYLRKLNGTKIVVRGNHDYWWETITKVRRILGDGVHALQNDSIRFSPANRHSDHSEDYSETSSSSKGIVLCGTRGWKVPERYQAQSADDKKIFEREAIRLEMALQDATKKMQSGDKLVAIIHYPPFNSMRDDSRYTGLMEKYKVDVCVYGHLHGKGGRKELEVLKNGVRYYLTSCDVLDFKVAEIEL